MSRKTDTNLVLRIDSYYDENTEENKLQFCRTCKYSTRNDGDKRCEEFKYLDLK